MLLATTNCATHLDHSILFGVCICAARRRIPVYAHFALVKAIKLPDAVGLAFAAR